MLFQSFQELIGIKHGHLYLLWYLPFFSRTCTSVISPFSSGVGGISVRTVSFSNFVSPIIVVHPPWMVPLDTEKKENC